MNLEFYNTFKNHGYVITEPLLNNDEIENLRSLLNEEFKDSDGIIIGIEKIKNKNILKRIIKIFNSQKINEKILEVEKKINKKIFLLPKFQIHKNYHVNLKEFHGWHRDCGGELKFDYCKKILYENDYIFSKVGIYLQQNTEYGGSIDVVQNSHKNFTRAKTLFRKIRNLPLRAVMFLHKYFNKIYFSIPEKFFMFFLGAKKLFPSVGAAVLFDSRLIHRGSPISKNKLKEVKLIKGQYHVGTTNEKIKYSLYCQLGTSDALDSYLYDRLKRKGNADELSNWFEQIKLIEEIDNDFAQKIKNIIKPIYHKYN